jgi:predicted O-linked N-acetylglucosamine transferase (SPINDLY family)
MQDHGTAGKRSRVSAGQPDVRLQVLTEAIASLEAKDFERAELLAKQALSINARDADAWHLVGVVAARQGQHARAADAIGHAIALNPNAAQFHVNLGNARFEQGDDASAIESYRRAIELEPSNEAVHKLLAGACERQLDLGIEHHRAGRQEEAKVCYELVLRGQPERADALHLLGLLAFQRKDFAAAMEFIGKAISLSPSSSKFHASLGNVLLAQEDHARALASFETALRLEPDSAQNLYYSALCHYRLRHHSEALLAVTQSIALDPNAAASHNLVGGINKNIGRSHEGIAAYRLALERDPTNSRIHSNLLFALNYQEDATSETIFSEHLSWGARHADSVEPRRATGLGAVEKRPLRVGYVSADLRAHSVAYFLEPLLEARDRSGIHVTCYANSTKYDTTTQRLQGLSDAWRIIAGMSDEEAAALIRGDRIDILVDLSGHTSGNRLPLFARRAAPVQVTYLGYPNTSGLEAMDYRLTDVWADPPGLTDAFYTEDLVRLEGGHLCYRPFEDSPEVRELPALANGYITFGSFNNLSKVGETLIGRWASILAGVPGSRLFLKAKPLADLETREFILALFARNGIARDRLELTGWAENTGSHLELYGKVDIALDTFPYHGTTTTCEALWMGVPVVTCSGETYASRVGVSLMTGIGLTDLIAPSMDSYVDVAINLAKDVARLRRIRAGLRSQVASSPLTDRVRTARAVEAAYRAMWRRHCAADV